MASRGRKPAETPEGTEVIVRTDVLAEDAQAMTNIAIGQQMVMDSTEALKRIGRLEALEFVATVAERVIAETYIGIKESKIYKGLPYKKDGKVETVSTLQEFCEVFMPHGYRRCEQIAENYHLLGPELYEQAEAIGFRQRDYGALKALPADDQAVVRQAIEAGKFDNAIELMQDMAIRHAKETEALRKEAAEAKADSEATGRLLQDKNAKIDELATSLNKQIKSVDMWNAQLLSATDEISQIGTVGDEVLGKHLAFIELCESIKDQLDPDAAGYADKLEQARVPISRLNEQLQRYGHLVARLQWEFETRLSMYLDQTHVLDSVEA